jgi:type II secretory pathway component PulF
LIQTFFRPVAGAIAFAATAGVVTDIHPVLALTCGLLVAGGVHTVKSAIVRPAVTATTAGAGNTPVSILEDITATVVSFLSILIPILIVFIIILFVVLIVMWRKQRSRSHNLA